MIESGAITKASLYVELDEKPCIVLLSNHQVKEILNYIVNTSEDRTIKVVDLPDGFKVVDLTDLEDEEEFLH